MKNFLTFSLGAATGYFLLCLFLDREKNPLREWLGEQALRPSALPETTTSLTFGRARIDRVSDRKFAVSKSFSLGEAAIPVYAGEVIDEGTHLAAFRKDGESRLFSTSEIKDAAHWVSDSAEAPGYLKSAFHSGSFLRPLFDSAK